MISENTVATRTSSYLNDFLSDVFLSIEFGTVYCLEQFEKDKEVIQNTRLTDTIRYKTRLELEKKGYKPANLSMNGLQVAHKGYDIKIFKAGRNGEVPIAGTERRLAFYNHHYGLRTFDFENIQAVIDDLDLEDRRELVILYKLSPDGVFLGIELVCVEKAESLYGIPFLAWRNAVSHPMANAHNKHDRYAEKPKDDLGNISPKEDERDDLDIFKDGTNE